MKRIVFAGAYGIQSQGDDAPLLVMTSMLRETYGQFDGVVVSRPPGGAEYSALGLRSVANFEYATKAESLGKWFRGFNPEDDRTDLLKLESEIAGSDLLVLGAGNALVDQCFDLLRGPVPYFLALTLMARMSGVPVMWYGLSIGPLRTPMGRKYARLCLDLAASVTVRDAKSVVVARDIGYQGSCKQLPDPVLGLTAPASTPCSPKVLAWWRQAHDTSADVVAVSVRALPPGCMSHEEWVGQMAALLDTLHELHGLRPLFIPQCTYSHGGPLEDDRVVAEQVVAAMKHGDCAVQVKEHLSVDECLSLYAGARLALCTRLHGVVFAAMNGIPVVAFGYHPKVEEFMHWLKQPEQIVPLETPDIEHWLGCAGKALAMEQADRRRMIERVKEGRNQVQEYGRIASALLAQGDDLADYV